MDDQWLAVGQRRWKGGDKLVTVLAYAQEHPRHVKVLLQLTLAAIAERLAKTRIIYPRPNRISLAASEVLLRHFLSYRTGGRRLQAAVAALFDAVGERFGLFHTVHVGHVNKSDAVRGDIADLDCRDSEGRTVLSVEVKDRSLSVREVEDTLQVARDRGIAEIIYVIRGGVPSEGQMDYERFKDRQFAAGHNVYEIEFEVLLHVCLILFGEAGRLTFLEAMGRRIDEHGDLMDRQAWQVALQAV